MTTTRERLTAIIATANAATEGPWLVHELDSVFVGPGVPGALRRIVHSSGDRPADMIPEVADRLRADAAFIADARTTTPALAAALLAVLDVLDETAKGYTATSERMAREQAELPRGHEDRPHPDDVARYAAYAGMANGAARRAHQAAARQLGTDL